MKTILHSKALNILNADDILLFVAQVVKPKDPFAVMEVFNTIALPMYNQYLDDSLGKDYIAYTEGRGFCFLSNGEILKKELVESN